MLNKISFQFAARLNIAIFSFLILFHAAVISGILLFHYVPLDFLWGGRIRSKEQFLLFEGISFTVQIIFLSLTLIRAGYFNWPRLGLVAHGGMWLAFFIFAVNTIGNILAKTTFEKSFALVTALLALFALRLSVGDETPSIHLRQANTGINEAEG